MDRKASTLLQMLSILQGDFHSTPRAGEATGGGNRDKSGDGGAKTIGVGGEDDSGISMHVLMEEGGTFVEEEGIGGDIDTRTTMHEAMEEGGTWTEKKRVGGDVDTGAAIHEHMKMGGTIIEEEAVDPTTFATSQFVWPCYKPTA
jgi:hypothetical protein